MRETIKQSTPGRFLWIGLAVLLAVGVGLYVATRGVGNGSVTGSSTASAPSAKSELDALAKGEVAAFVAKSAALPELAFNDADGKPKTMADFKGKVVLLNLWATWCAPCRKEMPMIEALQKARGGKDFEVLSLNMDRGTIDKAKAFFAEIKVAALLPYHDPSGKIGTTLGVIGLPATILIGRDGMELGRLVGPAEWDSPDALALIDAAMK